MGIEILKIWCDEVKTANPKLPLTGQRCRIDEATSSRPFLKEQPPGADQNLHRAENQRLITSHSTGRAIAPGR